MSVWRVYHSPSAFSGGSRPGSGRLAALPSARPTPSLIGRAAWRPTYLTSFIGRQNEVVAVGQLLTSTRLLTLIGAGGCGKSRLAAAVVDQARAPAEIGWVSLAPLTDPALVEHAVATALSVREQPGHPLTETLVLALRDEPLILVLDNCEHLIEACASLTETLLAACPQLTILATSRQVLGIAGELTWRVPSLSLPLPDADHSPASLAAAEAVQLFVARAGLVQPGFTLTDQNAGAVAHLCRRLDGLPLAIELAAARLNVLSVAQLAARLDDLFRLLASDTRMALPHHQTLRATIDWSYNLLSDAEHRLFDRLAVFAGGWTLEAAEAVCGEESGEDEVSGGKDGGVGRTIVSLAHPLIPSPDPDLPMLDLLARLVDRSLAAAAPGADGTMRYSLLETLRQYGWERLTASGVAMAIRRRHATYFFDLALTAAPVLWYSRPGRFDWLERLDREHDNLRATLRWCQEQQEVVWSLRLVWALAPFWWTRDYHREARGWLTEALERAATVESPTDELLRARGWALLGAGAVVRAGEEYPAAEQFFEQSRALFRELGERVGQAQATLFLGTTASWRGDFASGRRWLEEAVPLCQAGTDGPDISVAYFHLGSLALLEGDYAEARSLLERSLPVLLDHGDEYRHGHALVMLGLTLVLSGALDQARDWLERALVGLLARHDLWGLAILVEGVAALEAARGQAAAALRLAAAAKGMRAQHNIKLAMRSHLAVVERSLMPARQALSQSAQAAAATEGQALSLEAVLAEARVVLARSSDALPIATTRPTESAAPAVPAEPAAPSSTHQPSELTRREYEILRLIATGKSSREIAEVLSLSARTVERHTTTIYSKLEIHNRAEATAYAFRHHLI